MDGDMHGSRCEGSAREVVTVEVGECLRRRLAQSVYGVLRLGGCLEALGRGYLRVDRSGGGGPRLRVVEEAEDRR